MNPTEQADQMQRDADNAKAIRMLEEWRVGNSKRGATIDTPVDDNKYWTVILRGVKPCELGEGPTLLSAVEDALSKWEG